MENLEPYLDKFSESGRRVLEISLNETRRREQHFISPEHIVYALMTEETDLFNATMHNFSIDPQDIRVAVEKRLENSYRHTGNRLRIAPDTTEIFKYSMDRARSEGRRTIEASDICFAWIAYQYHQSPGLKHSLSSKDVLKSLGEFMDMEYVRTIPVVTASGIETFLRWSSQRNYL